MKKNKTLLITGFYLLVSIAAAMIAFPGTLGAAGLPANVKSAKYAQYTGDSAVQADLIFRFDQYKNVISSDLFVLPRDSQGYLSAPELFTVSRLEPSGPTPDPAIPEGCDISTNLMYETNLFELINEEREKRNLEPLTWNDDLASSARKHSINMACNEFFSHVDPEGLSYEDRIKAEGYDYFAVGENIYAGDEAFNSSYRAFRAWFYSTPHFVVMTHTALTEVGIGYVYCPDSPYGGYFTADFASPE